MKKYIGKKIIKAEPMTLGEAYKFIKKSVSKDEDKNTEGYLVGYPNIDGKTFNGSLKENCSYFSWSPKKVFENVYKLIED